MKIKINALCLGLTLLLSSCGSSTVDDIAGVNSAGIDSAGTELAGADSAGTDSEGAGELGTGASGTDSATTDSSLIDSESLSTSGNYTEDNNDKSSSDSSSKKTCSKEIDLDLTSLSSTMVYSEVYNMMVTPEDYFGKIVKMQGTFAVYEDQESGQVYLACLISDATACCSQGIEFLRVGDYTYPEDFPELGSEITVVGEFETYNEGDNTYCRLKDAEMTVVAV